MSAAELLSRLDRVRKTGPVSWRSLCPAHDNKKSLTLAIRDADDGRVLVKCFAGCSADDILGSVGLTIDALFPQRLAYNHGPMRRSFPAADVLESIAQEASIVAVAASNARNGIALSGADHERLLVAAERIHEARTLANGESYGKR